jgi:hypothetical protein
MTDTRPTQSPGFSPSLAADPHPAVDAAAPVICVPGFEDVDMAILAWIASHRHAGCHGETKPDRALEKSPSMAA